MLTSVRTPQVRQLRILTRLAFANGELKLDKPYKERNMAVGTHEEDLAVSKIIVAPLEKACASKSFSPRQRDDVPLAETVGLRIEGSFGQ